jgi:ribosome biogenesis GTPase
MTTADLAPYGWSDRWAALLHEYPSDHEAGRVVRHDGAGLIVATASGVRAAPLAARLDPPPAVGDWVVLDGELPVGVLARASLLSRKDAHTDTEQPLAANVDLVLLVCGLDRPVKPGRIERGATLAWDAGATPVVVLTKADLVEDVEAVRDEVAQASPGLDVVATSTVAGHGLDELPELVRDRTVVLLGESGAGKSSIVNALLGEEAATIGEVRSGDAKGRHTTTSRELHLVPSGGVVIDTPGIRAVGLWADTDAVAATFADIDELAATCRFSDCRHDTEPGCAVVAVVEYGDLAPERLESWRALEAEAAAAELRADPRRSRQANRRFGKVVKEAKQLKRR